MREGDRRTVRQRQRQRQRQKEKKRDEDIEKSDIDRGTEGHIDRQTDKYILRNE